MHRSVERVVAGALRRYARARPRDAQATTEDVVILVASAWGMGGTIRATLNLAGHLAQRHQVEVISLVRRREEPFFALPEKVEVTALDDRRPGAAPRGAQRWLMRRPSVLLTPHDRLYREASLWTDLALVRRLRRRRAFLIGTRPGLNLVAAELALPGVIAIGQEHMHVRRHGPALRRAIRRGYPGRDALVVLTDRDLRRYDRLLEGRVRLLRIPNAVPPRLGAAAPLRGSTVLAAGRLRPQKGFDMLIEAFAQRRPGIRTGASSSAETARHASASSA